MYSGGKGKNGRGKNGAKKRKEQGEEPVLYVSSHHFFFRPSETFPVSPKMAPGRPVLLCDKIFGKKTRLQYKRNFPGVYLSL